MLKIIIVLLVIFNSNFTDLSFQVKENTVENEQLPTEESLDDEAQEEEEALTFDTISEEADENIIQESPNTTINLFSAINQFTNNNVSATSFTCFTGSKPISEVFPDPTVAQFMAKQSRLTVESKVTCAQIGAWFFSIYITSDNIYSLEGIQYLKNITSLAIIGNNPFTDISPLTNLTKLRFLHLRGSAITSIAGLEVLDSLYHLDISYTKVNDLTPIQDMNIIGELHLNYLDLNDTMMDQLSNVTTLDSLEADNSNVPSLNALRNLTNLTYIYMPNNKLISDLTPLSGLIKLRNVTLSNCSISDVKPLSGLINIFNLNLSNNHITDISALSKIVSGIRAYDQVIIDTPATYIDTGQSLFPLTRTNSIINKLGESVLFISVSNGGSYVKPNIRWADVGLTTNVSYSWSDSSANSKFSGTITTAIEIAETVTERYITRKGIVIQPPTSSTIIRPNTYSKNAQNINNYTFIGFKVGDDTIQTGIPTIEAVRSNLTIDLIYGIDNNNDGIEDTFLLTEEYHDRLGNKLSIDTHKTIHAMSDYVGSPQVYSDYVYIGHTIDDGALQYGEPKIIDLNSNHKVTMVYGVDSNNDSIEDRYIITEKYEDRFGDSIPGLTQSSQTIYASLPYALTPPTVSGYIYVGYKIDDGLTQTGQPTLPFIFSDYSVTLIYRLEGEFTITENYFNRIGDLLAPPTSQIIGNTNAYSGMPETISNYVYAAYRINNGALMFGMPTIPSVRANDTIDFIYGVDNNNDGIEDVFTINESYVNRVDAPIKANTSSHVYGLISYTMTPPVIPNHMYLGYFLNNSLTLIESTPSIASITTAHTIKLLYGIDGNHDGIEDVYTVTEKHEDRSGISIHQNTLQPITALLGYSNISLTIPNYLYVGFKINDGPLQIGNPSITSLTDNIVVNFIYGVDNNNDGIEDTFSITERYLDLNENILEPEATSTVMALDNFYGSIKTLTDYEIVGYSIDGSEMLSGIPVLSNIFNYHTIDYYYHYLGDHTITEICTCLSGTPLSPYKTLSVSDLSSFTDVPLTIDDYIYMGYRINSNVIQLGNPVLDHIMKDQIIELVYNKISDDHVINSDKGWLLSAQNIDMSINNFMSYRAAGIKPEKMILYGQPNLLDYTISEPVNVTYWNVTVDSINPSQNPTSTYTTFTYVEDSTGDNISLKVKVNLISTLPTTGIHRYKPWLYGGALLIIGGLLVLTKKRRKEI